MRCISEVSTGWPRLLRSSSGRLGMLALASTIPFLLPQHNRLIIWQDESYERLLLIFTAELLRYLIKICFAISPQKRDLQGPPLPMPRAQSAVVASNKFACLKTKTIKYKLHIKKNRYIGNFMYKSLIAIWILNSLISRIVTVWLACCLPG